VIRALIAVVLGLTGATFVCTFTYFNDAIMHQTMFVGNNMPISVYGGLVILALFINPLLRKISKKLSLNGWQLAVVLVMTLAACAIPGSGLMRTFTCSLVMPRHYEKVTPAWQSEGVLNMVPERMLADPSEDDETAVTGFIQGISTPTKKIEFGAVPWKAWMRALSTWLPLIVTLWVALAALALVFHRQWSEKERLPYPIAEFAIAVMPSGESSSGGLLSNKLFWMGILPILAIHLNNYGCEWFPDYMIRIPVRFNFLPLANLGMFKHVADAWYVWYPTIYFTATAFAYFLATDVSLSLGVGPLLCTFLSGMIGSYGINLRGGGSFSPKQLYTFLGFGAYMAMFLSITYAARHYLVNVGKLAFGMKSGEDIKPHAVWGARVFLVCLVIFIFQLTLLNVDWQVAIIYALCLVVMFTIMSRVVAETGVFFIQALWYPSAIMMGIFGTKFLGPELMAIIVLLTCVLALDTREALMVFIVNSLKIMDVKKVDLGMGTILCMVAVLTGLCVAVPWVLYKQYDEGANMSDRWSTDIVPRFPFDEAVMLKQRLEAQGVLEEVGSTTGWQRFSGIAPHGGAIITLLIAAGLVFLCFFMRMRVSWWIIHPVMFIIWHTYPGQMLSISILLGCIIKAAVVKYGGAHTYQKFKPVMIGVIAGDMLGGLIPMLIGFIYYLATGELPKSFRIMPG
jgi:hypothetical protein